MYQEDYLYPLDHNDYDNNVNEDSIEKKKDKGLNTLTIKVQQKNGRIKNKQIKVYTSCGAGTKIRDAETGVYFPNKVGSKDEELFFKVAIATGECNSRNGSNTLFYCSPQHYENHLHTNVDPTLIVNWEKKRDARLKFLNEKSAPVMNTIIVK